MKKFFIFLLIVFLAVCVVGCKGSVEKKVSKYKVGDIVLNDGTYLRDVDSVSDADKEKAIAVIYKVSGSKAYGVGLVHNHSGVAWCLSSANGYTMKFLDLLCKVSGNEGNYIFRGDVDGSDNFSKMKEFLGNNDDTGIMNNYPAFKFTEEYKKQKNAHVEETVYATGWYLPTISELFDIWKVKSIIEEASILCGGSQFLSDWYWSSSQTDSFDNGVYKINFTDGTVFPALKENNKLSVCCIHLF